MPVHQLQFFLNPWILAFILNGWLEGSKDQQCMMHIALALIWFSDWSDWFLVGDCRVASSHCFSWGWRRTASQTPSTNQQGKTFSPALPPTLGYSSHLNYLNHQMQFLLSVSPVSPGWSTKQCRACSKAQPLQSHHFLQLSQLLLCHALPQPPTNISTAKLQCLLSVENLFQARFSFQICRNITKDAKACFRFIISFFLSQPANEA